MRIAAVAVVVLLALPAGVAAASSQDRTPPRVAVHGAGGPVSRQALASGLRIDLGVDEPVRGAAEVLVGHARIAIPRLPDRVVASRSFAMGAGVHTVRLGPAHGLPAGRRVRVRVRVVAFDAAGNLGGRTVGLSVR
jgi:hypothetical protein